jgi:hypothetical protein
MSEHKRQLYPFIKIAITSDLYSSPKHPDVPVYFCPEESILDFMVDDSTTLNEEVFNCHSRLEHNNIIRFFDNACKLSQGICRGVGKTSMSAQSIALIVKKAIVEMIAEDSYSQIVDNSVVDRFGDEWDEYWYPLSETLNNKGIVSMVKLHLAIADEEQARKRKSK